MKSNDATGAALRDPEAKTEHLRASLSARADAEALVVEASAARRAAALDADRTLAEAQRVAAELVSDSRSRADHITGRAQSEAQTITAQARVDAGALRARAESEVEEYRRRVRAEVTEQVARELREQAQAELAVVREQSAAMIGDLEASVRILGVALETAHGDVAGMLSALGDLRTHTAEQWAAEPAPRLHDRADHDAHVDELNAAGRDQGLDHDDEQARSGVWSDELDDDLDDKVARPLTALEAYLQSAHIDHGDPPLPVVDDTQVGLRYVEDAHRGRPMALVRDSAPGSDSAVEPTADSRSASSRSGEPEPDHVTAPSRAGADRNKPLGWLFRSAP